MEIEYILNFMEKLLELRAAGMSEQECSKFLSVLQILVEKL